MKSVLTVLFVSALAPRSFSQTREGSRALPQKLRGLPVGILVLHHPNPCYPVKAGEGYVWTHDTSIRSLVGDLTVVEYGAYLFKRSEWVLRTSMTPSEFAATYRCPSAKLKARRTYVDPQSSRRSEKAVAGDALWYFIAKDPKGTLYKGFEIIETEGLDAPVPNEGYRISTARKSLTLVRVGPVTRRSSKVSKRA